MSSHSHRSTISASPPSFPPPTSAGVSPAPTMDVDTPSFILQPQAQTPRPKSPPLLSQQLSVREKLLFSQAVYKVGAGNDKNWKAVGDLLATCPLVEGDAKREREFWNVKTCKTIYRELLSAAGLPSPERLSGIESPNAPPHLRLAQFFYKMRMEELKSDIEEQETQFRNLIQEIDTIKSSSYISTPATNLAQNVIFSIREMWNSKHPDRKLGSDWVPTSEVADAEEIVMENEDIPCDAVEVPLAEVLEVPVESSTPEEDSNTLEVVAEPTKARPSRSRKTPQPEPEQVAPPISSDRRPASPLPLQVQPSSRRQSPLRANSVPSSIIVTTPVAEDTEEIPVALTSAPDGAGSSKPKLVAETVSSSATAESSRKGRAIEASPSRGTTASRATRNAVDVAKGSPKGVGREELPAGEDEQDVQIEDMESEEAAVDALAVDSTPSPDVDEKPPVEEDDDDDDDEDVLALGGKADREASLDKKSSKSRAQTSRLSRTISRETDKEEPARSTKRSRGEDEKPSAKASSSRGGRSSSEKAEPRSTRNRPSATPARAGRTPVKSITEAPNESDSDNDLTPPPASPPASDVEPPLMSPALPPKKTLAAPDSSDRGRERLREKPTRASARTRRGTVEEQSDAENAEDDDAGELAKAASASSKVGRTGSGEVLRSRSNVTRGRSDDTAEVAPRDVGGRHKRGRDITPIEEEVVEPKELRRSRRAAGADASDPMTEDHDMDAEESAALRPETRRTRGKREVTAEEAEEEEEEEEEAAEDASPPKKRFKTSDDKRERDRLRYAKRREGEKQQTKEVQSPAGESEEPGSTPRSKLRLGTSETMEQPVRTRRAARGGTPEDKGSKAILTQLLNLASTHKYGSIFAKPLKESDAPGYYEIVKKPMDLKTIKEKIKNGSIANLDDMHSAMLTMFANALLYNAEGTPVHQMAEEMMVWCEKQIEEMRNLQHLMSRS